MGGNSIGPKRISIFVGPLCADRVEKVGNCYAKFLLTADPAARWTGAHGGQAFFAYFTNYLMDVENAVIVDMEATTAIRQAEVLAAKARLSQALSPEVQRVLNRVARPPGTEFLAPETKGEIGPAALRETPRRNSKMKNPRNGALFSRIYVSANLRECVVAGAVTVEPISLDQVFCTLSHGTHGFAHAPILAPERA